MSNKKVLIFEFPKQQLWLDLWQDILGDEFDIITAVSVDEAKEKFAANPDVAAIVVGMDVNYPTDRPGILELVGSFRERFKGPMIATSTFFIDRQRLIEAGCEYQCERENLPEKLREVLAE